MTKENKGKKLRRLQLGDRTHTAAASRKANKGKKGAVSLHYSRGHGNSGKFVNFLQAICVNLF